jgi:tRNA A-37 threonylcarbamoyl transferase component Bud32
VTAAGDGKPMKDPETLDALRDRLMRDPDDREARLRIGRRLAAGGDLAAARAMLAPLESMRPATGEAAFDPHWAHALAALAAMDEQSGDFAAAAARWERLLADDVDHAEAQARLGRLRTAQPTAPSRLSPLRTDVTILAPEGTLVDRYEILSEVGRGATSTVYLAREVNLGIEVALKVLHPHIGAASRASARERFFWEARIAARLRHPGVVAIYDLDEAARSLTMEYLPAGTLRTRMAEAKHAGDAANMDGGHLPGPEILRTVVSLLRTLTHVHDAGLIHGDLKPRNVLLRAPGVPVLGDFGVARLLQDERRRSEPPAGTPLYLAPEQLRGEVSSVKSDLFALGSILWELAAGRPMRTRADLLSGRHHPPVLPPEAVESLRARLPGEAPTATALVSLVMALTAADPALRPASAAEALRILNGD